MGALSVRAAFVAASLLFSGMIVQAAETQKTGAIEVRNAHARIVPSNKMGAVYLTIVNTSKEPDRLVAASTPVAGKAEPHTVADDNGVMKMRPADGIVIRPGETVTLKPGGLHIMLMGVQDGLKPGDQFPLQLIFDKAGVETVSVTVDKPSGHGH